MTTLYIYSTETNTVVARIHGESNEAVEAKMAELNYDGSDDFGATYSPAFGTVDGLTYSDAATDYHVSAAPEFIEREQDWQNEATRYWFRMDGAEYAVVESGSSVDVLDADGKEITDRDLEIKLRARLVVTDEMRAA